MSPRVVVTDAAFPDLAQEESAARTLGADFAAFACRSAHDVVEAVAGADVAVVQFAPFDGRAARAMRSGGTVIRYGVGYNNIDLTGVRAAGLHVGYVPDYCTEEVADHSAAAILALLRKLLPLDALVRAGRWSLLEVAKPLPPFAETTIGFFGLGAIGRAVLARLRPFGFGFVACDPGLTPDEADGLAVRSVDAEALLAEADLVSLHAPATPETTGFFDRARFARMRPGAMLVNAARGQLLVEADLADALGTGRVGGAALDVFVEEPLPADSPLRGAPNLILTPHAAWYSDAAIGRLQRLVAQDIARALRGEPPRRPVPERW